MLKRFSDKMKRGRQMAGDLRGWREHKGSDMTALADTGQTEQSCGESRIIFCTGGCRSGKSAFALNLAAGLPGSKIFVATAEAEDAEMQERIKKHRKERGPEWHCLEIPVHEALYLGWHVSQLKQNVLLLDCLSTWVSACLCAYPELFAAQRGADNCVSNDCSGDSSAGTVAGAKQQNSAALADKSVQAASSDAGSDADAEKTDNDGETAELSAGEDKPQLVPLPEYADGECRFGSVLALDPIKRAKEAELAITEYFRAFLTYLRQRGGTVILVSAETGLGLSPSSLSGRVFRDILGLVNQEAAKCADAAYFIASGLPLRLK